MTIREMADMTANITHDYQVEPDVYYAFQRCSSDYNPMHTDVKYAQEKGFDNRVMYGNILNTFLSHFVGMLLPTRSVMILSQSINYRKPFYLHDIISLDASIEQVSEAAGFITYKFKFWRVGEEGNSQMIANGSIQVGLIK